MNAPFPVLREFEATFRGSTPLTEKIAAALEPQSHRPGVVELRQRQAVLLAGMAVLACPGAAAARDQHVAERERINARRAARRAAAQQKAG